VQTVPRLKLCGNTYGIMKNYPGLTPAHMPNPKLDKDILQAALIGFEAQKRDIASRIAEIRAKLAAAPGTAKEPGQAKRTLSPETRKRIAVATKKRWGQLRAKSAAKKKSGGTSGTGPRLGKEAAAE